MMKKNKMILILALITSIWGVWGQQDSQFTQYMYNTLVVNPAYAGQRNNLSVNLLHRSQWVGLDGAPKTQTFGVHSPYKRRYGIGFSVINDDIGDGTSQETNFDIALAYTIQTSLSGKLSFGLKVGGNLLSVNFSKLAGYDREAQNLINIDNKFSPNIGVGFYYHTSKFYLGLSAPNLLETEHFDRNGRDASSFVSTERINFYLISGYVFRVSDNLKFKPAILFKAVSGSPLQADFSTNFLINKKFTLGAAYRWDAAFSGLFGFQITEQLMLGLAYDKETTSLGNTTFNDGSFEVFIRYEFIDKKGRIVSPRFF